MADGMEYRWIGRGTWLTDRRHYRPSVGVITDIRERDRGFGARIGIKWKADRYQNTSVLLALENLRSGRWQVEVDD